jgi:aminoglycoside phosphotransferase (APT) family kinase protein
MRKGWQRAEQEQVLDAGEVARLVRAALPRASVNGFRSVPGGLSNTNFEVTLSGPCSRVLLRLYQRDPAQARKEAALSTRVLSEGVPAARFLHLGERASGQPYAVLEWVEGFSLEALLPRLTAPQLAALASAIGETLAAIHAIRFPRTGFFDGGLALGEPIDLGIDGLRAYLRHCLIKGIGGVRLGAELTSRLIDHVDRSQVRLDDWLVQPSLTHADFNPSNILLRAEPTGWRVAAVLDWEFAFCGSPGFDFGNLLRPPLGRRPGFIRVLAKAYAAAGAYLPADWQAIARLTDLFAWADFLNRPSTGPGLIEDARQIIRRTIGG